MVASQAVNRQPHEAPAVTAPSFDVVVVGGGIVGTSAAAFLAEAGARVLLVEREGLASGASGANSGVVQHPFDPVLAGLYRATLPIYRELSAGSGTDHIPARSTGILFVATDEAAARRQATLIFEAFPELAPEILDGDVLQAIEPALAPDIWACAVDIGYPVTPGAATYAFATLAEARGAQIRQGRAATLAIDGDRVTGVELDGEAITAGAVLAAAGPWTPALLDPTGRWAPIRHRWGVVVEVELADPPSQVLEQAGIDSAIGGAVPDGDGIAYSPPVRPDARGAHDIDFSLVPRSGTSAIGSTFLAVEPDPAAWTEPILARASRFVPAVADAPIREVRACTRPQSVDGLPLVGAVAGRDGLYVCAGHGPWGISTGPASARLIVDLVLGRRPEIPAELDPARFGTPGGRS